MHIFLIGEKFNKLTILEELSVRANGGGKQYKCQCECGNVCVVRSDHLKSGHTTSCGCNKIIITSHRKSGTKLYHRYDRIKERCYNANNVNYKNYGGRGIIMCDEWKNDFMNFYDWAMNNGYRDTLTIDRIDVNGNYEPSNCRWITIKEQQNNKTNNVYLTCDGKTQTIAQWSNELGISYSTIHARYKRGLSSYECLYKKKWSRKRG